MRRPRLVLSCAGDDRGGDPDGSAIVVSLVTAGVLAALFLPLTTRLNRSC